MQSTSRHTTEDSSPYYCQFLIGSRSSQGEVAYAVACVACRGYVRLCTDGIRTSVSSANERGRHGRKVPAFVRDGRTCHESSLPTVKQPANSPFQGGSGRNDGTKKVLSSFCKTRTSCRCSDISAISGPSGARKLNRGCTVFSCMGCTVRFLRKNPSRALLTHATMIIYDGCRTDKGAV